MTVDEVLKLLQQTGHRITRQRRAVVEVALCRRQHFTAADISSEIRLSNPSLGRATVFRTLDSLASIGLLARIHGSDSCHSYIVCRDDEHHHHLVCSCCGLVVKVPGCLLEAQADKLSAQTGFRVDGHHLEFYGLCSRCQSGEKPMRPRL